MSSIWTLTVSFAGMAQPTAAVCGMERQARRLSAHIRRMHTERTEP